MMPNKTLYVREADLPLFELAQEQLGDSVSALFAEFIRERVTKLKPEEHTIIELINRITQKREALKTQPGLPHFLESEYTEAEANAGRSLKNLRAGQVKTAKIFLFAANAYYDWAERDVKEAKELCEKIKGMLSSGRKTEK